MTFDTLKASMRAYRAGTIIHKDREALLEELVNRFEHREQLKPQISERLNAVRDVIIELVDDE